MQTATKMPENFAPTVYPMPPVSLNNQSSAYYSVSKFRKLAQEDLQHLLKKHGRI